MTTNKEKVSMENVPALSLIISFYNNTRLLGFILEALSRQSFKKFEVIIADDGSSQEAVEYIQRIQQNALFKIKHIWHEDLGWRKNIALNNAVKASESDYMVFIDGDCIPHRKFLEDHYTNRKEHIVLSGRRVQLSQSMTERITTEWIKNGHLEKRLGQLSIILDGLFKHVKHSENAFRIRNPFIRTLFVKDKNRGILGCNFSIHKIDLLKVNGFDERYIHPGTGEDTDLDHRLQRAGINSVSKKHLLTLYHIHHKKFDLVHQPNLQLLKENDHSGIIYTPYGIQKKG